ncbi:hypothetical protein RPN242_gp036 [Escherichia phage vB_EcoM-RPN242]|nr:hypothetical protein RPN242_gp036 [Escherichia phage vB_EcoM-RPN242]
MKELPVNDKKYMYKVLLSLGVSQSGLARLLDCSNVVNYWAKGYRVVPPLLPSLHPGVTVHQEERADGRVIAIY